jgi:hypothetical protein
VVALSAFGTACPTEDDERRRGALLASQGDDLICALERYLTADNGSLAGKPRSQNS